MPLPSSSAASSTTSDVEFMAFLVAVQTAFMKEYAAGSIKRGYATK